MQFKKLVLITLTLNWSLIGVFTLFQWQRQLVTPSLSKPTHEELLKEWKPYIVVDEETQKQEELFTHHSLTQADTPEELATPAELIEEESVEVVRYTSGEVTEKPIFLVSDLPSDLKSELNQQIDPEEHSISVHDLKLVTVTHWGFDDSRYIGELLIHKDLADEVKEIFMEIFESHYPIEQMHLISKYGNSDLDSMADNNTSAFNYRVETAGSELSAHAYGLAIDINPKYNPYVSSDRVLPANGVLYTNRQQPTLGMIMPGDPLHQAFTSRGWSWGGDWSQIKDYQHFYKSLK